MSVPKKTFNEDDTHWKLQRIAQGLEAVSDDDDNGDGGYGELGSGTEVLQDFSQEDLAKLAEHSTRQERHLKEAKSLQIERQYLLNHGQSVSSSIQRSVDQNSGMAHPLSNEAQFHSNQENDNLDTNEERGNELQLRNTPENAPAPRTQPTPTLSR